MATRYSGEPLLRLTELYVLWAIGELPEAEAATLERAAPRLAAMWGGGGTWQEAVMAAMDIPFDLRDELRTMWRRNLDIARESGVTLTPEQFADMVVERNFAGSSG